MDDIAKMHSCMQAHLARVIDMEVLKAAHLAASVRAALVALEVAMCLQHIKQGPGQAMRRYK